MKKTAVKGALIGSVITLLFACNSTKTEEPAPAAAPIDKEQVKKEIQDKENEFAALYNNGEIKDIGYYADDATSFFQNKAPLVGKAAIVEFLKSHIISNTNKIEVLSSLNLDLCH